MKSLQEQYDDLCEVKAKWHVPYLRMVSGGERLFEEARGIARSLGLKSRDEWDSYGKSGKRSEDIPSAPDKVYKDKGWVSWGDWLGTGRVCTRMRSFTSFEEAREFARSLGLKGQNEWYDYCRSGKRPVDVPCAPEQIYDGKGWVSWGDWLGTGNVCLRLMRNQRREKAA